MASKVKSFRKVAGLATGPEIPGSQLSTQNFSLLTSSGIAALDTILGGGLPVGSLLVIEEDEFGQYSEVLAKYFVSEGVHSTHPVFLAGWGSDLDAFVKDLPGELSQEKKPTPSPSSSGEDMTIAWRYNNLTIADSTISGSERLGHKLRLNVEVKPDVQKQAKIVAWNGSRGADLLVDLVNLIQHPVHSIGGTSKNILRTCVLGLGSPLWSVDDVSRTLYLLRSWLRRSVAVGVVTIPTHLHKGTGLTACWRQIADIVIGLESFAGTDRALNPALKEYNGFLQVHKLPAFNSLLPHIPPTDLAFKLRRRHFIIERMSLPPELEDTTARAGGGGGCGSSSGSSPLDF